MSKVAIKGNASGTGTFTIAAPNSNTDRTLNLPDETGTVITSASDIESQVKTATNATGTAPIYACRAWVNFNGSGTVAIRESGNVSSVTDNGNGLYTVNFATSMPDVNYCFTAGTEQQDPSYFYIIQVPAGGTYSTSGLQIETATQNGSTTLFNRDSEIINIAVFR